MIWTENALAVEMNRRACRARSFGLAGHHTLANVEALANQACYAALCGHLVGEAAEDVKSRGTA